MFRSELLKTLSKRGFIKDITDENEFDNYLVEKQAKIYIGFDATAKSFHAGTLTPLMMLYWIQKTNHIPVVLMGGGTSLIGDPSGKDQDRKLLSKEDIDENINSLEKIFSKFVDFNGNNKALLVNNYDWLKKLNLVDFLREVGPHYTINRMLTFESVKSRLDREAPLSLLEFNYLLLQGYDFYHLFKEEGVVAQFGGSDQWGNILSGTELIRRKLRNDSFGLTAPLLVMANGKKMGKTENGAVWLSKEYLSPYDYWQYWRNIPDDNVVEFLYKFTILDVSEIDDLVQTHKDNINELKIILANETTSFLHGKEEAKKAHETAMDVFVHKKASMDLPSFDLSIADVDGFKFFGTLVDIGLAQSNSEIRRQINAKALRINDIVIDEPRDLCMNDINDGVIKISIGKKKHMIFKIIEK